MRDKNEVAAAIRAAFATTPYPGDAFLVGSSEGCEPEEEAGAFRARWAARRSSTRGASAR